jgi:hypothetical protein
VTSKQEQVALLEHRLTSKVLPRASSLLDSIIDNLDTPVNESNDYSSNDFDQMKQLAKARLSNKFSLS